MASNTGSSVLGDFFETLSQIPVQKSRLRPSGAELRIKRNFLAVSRGQANLGRGSRRLQYGKPKYQPCNAFSEVVYAVLENMDAAAVKSTRQ